MYLKVCLSGKPIRQLQKRSRRGISTPLMPCCIPMKAASEISVTTGLPESWRSCCSNSVLNEKTRHTCVYYPYNMEAEKQTIVVRVEISTLLGQNGRVSRRKMDRLAMVITNLHNSGMHVLVVSSGAIILGSEKLKLQQLPDTQLDMQATAAVGQAELMRWYQRSFDEYGQIVAQVLLTSDIIAYPQRVENTRNTFNTLLEMSIIPIINENDPVSTSDIEFDDNYPLALIVAQIARADFIVIKMEMNGKYLIIPGNNLAAMVVDGETELQEKLESCCHVMMNGKAASVLNFPASIGEIVF